LYWSTEAALKNQLVSAVPRKYLADRYDRSRGFSLVTTLQLLTHLWANYGKIDLMAISKNHIALLTPFWHPPAAIQDLFTVLDDRIDFAREAQAPVSDLTALQAALANVTKTGLFTTYLMTWRTRPEAERTYQQFKLFCIECDQDRLNNATAAELGYHSALTAQAITPTESTDGQTLPIAAIPDHQAMNAAVTTPGNHAMNAATQPATNAAPVTFTQAQVDAIVQKALQKQSRKTKRSQSPQYEKHYCWSHGESTTHNSVTCKFKKPGHQIGATLTDKMGGSSNLLK
jgi:hypothetical protein